MTVNLRAKTDESFLNDVTKSFGEGYTQRTKILGFPIGPKEVNTSKITNEIATRTIAHAAISPAQSSNFYKRAFQVCAAAAIVTLAYFGKDLIINALTSKSQDTGFFLQ